MRHSVRPLRSEADYDAALKAIERYFDAEPRPGSLEADRFDLLALVIEDYERKRWPIEAPDAVEAIKCRMAQADYRQADLAKLVGSKSRASEILNRKRHMTLEQVWAVATAWRIPADVLIKPYRLGALRYGAAKKGGGDRVTRGLAEPGRHGVGGRKVTRR